MAKKLTEREWYEAAQWWHGEDVGYKFSEARKETSRAVGANPDIVEDAERKISEDFDDRCYFYAQFCLEKAGL